MYIATAVLSVLCFCSSQDNQDISISIKQHRGGRILGSRLQGMALELAGSSGSPRCDRRGEVFEKASPGRVIFRDSCLGLCLPTTLRVNPSRLKSLFDVSLSIGSVPGTCYKLSES